MDISVITNKGLEKNVEYVAWKYSTNAALDKEYAGRKMHNLKMTLVSGNI
jgi:hypothetical protein